MSFQVKQTQHLTVMKAVKESSTLENFTYLLAIGGGSGTKFVSATESFYRRPSGPIWLKV